ncbi:MAG: hypothetical protein NUV50_00865 [Rhodospirillales bacterium]|nr:hypothetical protein [Rhodospirillales bacterium]
MSTYFPAGGTKGSPGHWWRMVHSAIEAGADLSALRLIHVAGMPTIDETVCAAMEERLGTEAACMCYDATSLLVIEPGVHDVEIFNAACEVLNATPEQVRLWAAVNIHDNGLDFQPLAQPDSAATTLPAPAVTPSTHDLVLTDAEFSYLPLWDVEAGEIFCYVCEVVWNVGDGSRVPEEALDTFFAKTRHVFALDRSALHKAVTQAKDFLDRYMFTNIMIPVHYSTITDPIHRAAYFDACNEGIWAVMDNVYFEISKVPADVDGAALTQAIEDLIPYSSGVMLRVKHGFTNFAAFPANSVMSVGLDFHYDDRTDAEIEVELRTFAQACQQAQVRCHAHNLRDMDICISASSAGYTYISSTVIAPPLDMASPEDEMAASMEALRMMLRKHQ